MNECQTPEMLITNFSIVSIRYTVTNNFMELSRTETEFHLELKMTQNVRP